MIAETEYPVNNAVLERAWQGSPLCTPYSSSGACACWAVSPVWRTVVSPRTISTENCQLEKGRLGDPSCPSKTSASVTWRHLVSTLTPRRRLRTTDVPGDRKVFPRMKTPWRSRQRKKRADRSLSPRQEKPAWTFFCAHCRRDCNSRIALCNHSRHCSRRIHQRRNSIDPRDWRMPTNYCHILKKKKKKDVGIQAVIPIFVS